MITYLHLSISSTPSLALLTAFAIIRVFVDSQNQFAITGDRDKAIVNAKHLLKTLAMDGKSMHYCLGQCLQDCLCMSFQICHMTECQLCSSNKYKNSSALESKKGCTNFVFGNKRSEVRLCSKTVLDKLC